MRFLKIVLVVTAVVFILSVQPHNACRVLDGEKEEWMKIRIVPLKSMLSGPVPPSGPSSCSHIPEKGSPCPSGMKFTGHAIPPHRASSHASTPVVMATEHK